MFLEPSGLEPMNIFPQKWKACFTLYHLALNGALVLGGLYGFWRQHIPYLNVLIETIYRIIHEGPDVEWGPRAKKRLCSKLSLQYTLLC